VEKADGEKAPTDHAPPLSNHDARRDERAELDELVAARGVAFTDEDLKREDAEEDCANHTVARGLFARR
jgi:hypothetical protein